MVDQYKVSYCTHILNRWHQLKLTLPHNINHLTKTGYQWVIVDFSSDDGMDVGFFNHPNIKYIRLPRPAAYNIPNGKNIALREADGEYLYSIDADVYLDVQMRHRDCPTHGFSGKHYDGTYGIIGATKDQWNAIDYFPTHYANAGIHDEIAINRLNAIKHVCRISVSKLPIQNSKADTVKNMTQTWGAMQIAGKQILRRESEVFVPKSHTVFLPKGRYGWRQGWSGRLWHYATYDKQLRYRAIFSDDFIPGRGGKLPGIGGGSCPHGGRKSNNGFSARVMWLGDQLGAYVYHAKQKGSYGDFYPVCDFSKIVLVEMVFNRGLLTIKINNNSLEIDVGYRHCNVAMFDVFRGGNDSSWAVSNDGEIIIENVYEFSP